MTTLVSFGIVRPEDPPALGVVAPPESPALRLMQRSRFSPARRPSHLKVSSADDLEAPLRIAIVAARQALLAAQQTDGTWRESRCSVRATGAMATLFGARDLHSEQVRAACRWLLEQQRSDGGWSEGDAKGFDLDASVLAYLALRTAGYQPWEEPLQAARDAIRKAGGADAVGTFTRCWLARAGQIPWPEIPECHWLSSSALGEIETNCGVLIRELFFTSPREWSPSDWRPWTAEERLLWKGQAEAEDNFVMLDDGVGAWRVDEARHPLTAAVCTALLASGLGVDDEFIVAALSTNDIARVESALLLDLLDAWDETIHREPTNQLPPQLTVGRDGDWHQSFSVDPATTRERFAEALRRAGNLDEAGRDSPRKLAEAIAWAARCDEMQLLQFARRLIDLQSADGRWTEAGESVMTTCRAVRALSRFETELAREAVEAGVYWLQAYQNANGGWSSQSENSAEPTGNASLTAQGLLALVAAGCGDSPAADRAVQELIATQSLDGDWDSNLPTTAACLLALSRWATAARRTPQLSEAPALAVMQFSDC